MKLTFKIVFAMFVAATEVLCQPAPTSIRTITVEQFNPLMDSLKDEILIDLRTPDEVRGGVIRGARVIDYFGADFESSIQGLDRNKVYVLYCAGGGRSGETAEIMDKLGFKKIYNLQGGFNEWTKKKMPVRKSN